MQDQTHNSLIQGITSAIQTSGNPLKLTFKAQGNVIFELEVENLRHHLLQDQVCQLIHVAVKEAATSVLVQNKK